MKISKKVSVAIDGPNFPAESLRLIGAALALQQAKKTAANIVPLPGTGRFVVIGTPAEVARLMEIGPAWPDCGACPGDGSICTTECRHRAENPPAATADWAACERIANIDSVDEALQGFSEDPTGDNGALVVRTVLEALEVMPAEVAYRAAAPAALTQPADVEHDHSEGGHHD